MPTKLGKLVTQHMTAPMNASRKSGRVSRGQSNEYFTRGIASEVASKGGTATLSVPVVRKPARNKAAK